MDDCLAAAIDKMEQAKRKEKMQKVCYCVTVCVSMRIHMCVYMCPCVSVCLCV